MKITFEIPDDALEGMRARKGLRLISVACHIMAALKTEKASRVGNVVLATTLSFEALALIEASLALGKLADEAGEAAFDAAEAWDLYEKGPEAMLAALAEKDLGGAGTLVNAANPEDLT